MFIPEIIIEDTLRIIFKFIRDDYESSANEQSSYIFSLFGEGEENETLKLGNFNYYEQAKHLFVERDNNDNRKNLQIFFGYNLKRAGTPSIHILMPNETNEGASIGDDEGFGGNTIYNNSLSNEELNQIITEDDDVIQAEVDGVRKNINQSTEVKFNLLITSNNSIDVILIYYLLKNALLAGREHLEIKGFHNVTFGGSDLIVTDDMVPPNIFHRNFTMSFSYDYKVPRILFFDRITNIDINGTAENND